MLEVKNIHKKFGSNEVLKGVDFKVEKGSVIAVLGNSGSGKTTLLRCISFLEQADKGEITFDDFHKDHCCDQERDPAVTNENGLCLPGIQSFPQQNST